MESHKFSFENIQTSANPRTNRANNDPRIQNNFNARKIGSINHSMQPTQYRNKFNSPYSKNYNDEYYRMAQFAKK
jgi:hypothetical protein